MRILFVSSEAHPVIKTGGLADVSGSLAITLARLGHDVRLVLPYYAQVRNHLPGLQTIARPAVPNQRGSLRILRGELPSTDGEGCPLWLVDSPYHFDRHGGPYIDHNGADWPDNGERFGLFCQVGHALAQGRAGLDWRPDLVHCNDWQTGLICALLAQEPERPRTVFTIHNLAYQGLYPRSLFDFLKLPEHLWTLHGLEYHGLLSFIKGGLVFADRLTSVSPGYAREILSSAYGRGLHGVLQLRQGILHGILNGIDTNQWNPGNDPHIWQNYSVRKLARKRKNTHGLRTAFELADTPSSLLLGMVTRLVHQKGIDLVLEALPELMKRPVQLVIQGSGNSDLERALQDAQRRWPTRLRLNIGYSETTAHRIEAGADAFLMPSRFEPCGLNQMYSLRYGTPPIVRRTGGLADTVVDASPAALADGQANGFVFDEPSAEALVAAVDRAVALFERPKLWRALMRAGMKQDFSWQRSAERYLQLYEELLGG